MDGACPTHTSLPALMAQHGSVAQRTTRAPAPRPLPPVLRPPTPPHSPAAQKQEAVLKRRRSSLANQKSPAGLQPSNRIGQQTLRPASEARFSDGTVARSSSSGPIGGKEFTPPALRIPDWLSRGEGGKRWQAP